MKRQSRLLIALVALAVAGGSVCLSKAVLGATKKSNSVTVYGKPSNIDAKAGTFMINTPTRMVRNVSTAAANDSNTGPFKVVTNGKTKFIAAAKADDDNDNDKDNDNDRDEKASANPNANVRLAADRDNDNDNDNDRDEQHEQSAKQVSKATFFAALKPTDTVAVVGTLSSGKIKASQVAVTPDQKGSEDKDGDRDKDGDHDNDGDRD